MKKDGSGVLITGMNGDSALYARVIEHMQRHLDRLGVRPVSGRAAFTDEDGPKGGRAIRCALTITVPYRPSIHAEQTALDQRRAFDGAMASLARELARYRRRDRDEKRHPKKYFAAAQAGVVEPRPARRRARRAS